MVRLQWFEHIYLIEHKYIWTFLNTIKFVLKSHFTGYENFKFKTLITKWNLFLKITWLSYVCRLLTRLCQLYAVSNIVCNIGSVRHSQPGKSVVMMWWNVSTCLVTLGLAHFTPSRVACRSTYSRHCCSDVLGCIKARAASWKLSSFRRKYINVSFSSWLIFSWRISSMDTISVTYGLNR